MNWAISLIINAEKSVEERVKSILMYIQETSADVFYVISEVDATGKLGSELTKRLNGKGSEKNLSSEQIFAIFNEDGQVFEMELSVQGSSDYRIIITDGMHVDVLGDGARLPESIAVPYEEMDVNLF